MTRIAQQRASCFTWQCCSVSLLENAASQATDCEQQSLHTWSCVGCSFSHSQIHIPTCALLSSYFCAITYLQRLPSSSKSSVTMCTTSQYLYNCLHPASYRFRTCVCRNPASSSCRVRDENSFLLYTCPKCASKSRTRNGKQASGRNKQDIDINIMVAKKTWHVPSRCFIDTGFRNLDPFRTQTKIEAANNAGLQSPQSTISKAPLIMDGSNTNARNAEQLRQPSPCCLKSGRLGAYQATRLEGIEDRQRGRIMDSLCGSLW